jgi:hypothetical protein
MIFWPVIAQAALTFVAYVVMSARRVAAVKAGQARARDFSIPNDPAHSATAARNVTNQFEIPVLFYVVCLAAFQTGAAAGAGFIVLAWLFVLSRFVHAWVHMTSNRVILRRRVFMVGYFALVVMWGWFAVHLASGAGGPL